jgi:AmmeMemoRadiSam system protein B
MMAVRQPFRAGSFYPAERAECEAELSRCMGAVGPAFSKEPARRCVAVIAPHAAWAYSGTTAAHSFSSIAAANPLPRTVVIVGAVHVSGVYRASLMTTGSWKTPLGEIEINSALAGAIRKRDPNLIADDAWVHRVEHSIEVLLPFIQKVVPGARFVPLMVPPLREASRVGMALAEAIASIDEPAVIVGSTDLTHYGEDTYGFAPAGSGFESLEWVKQENDRRMIDLMLRMRPDDVVEEARAHHNACGAGAIAATLVAAKALGAKKGQLLRYTTSYDERPEGPPRDFVGYASVLFG